MVTQQKYFWALEDVKENVLSRILINISFEIKDLFQELAIYSYLFTLKSLPSSAISVKMAQHVRRFEQQLRFRASTYPRCIG